MAIRKQRLRHRIAAMGGQQAAVAAASHPAGTAATPMVMPLSVVVVSAAQGQYVTLGSMEYTPLFAPDGAMIPATGPGRWGQLAAAGRP
jgi:hypothetical protein